MRREEIETDSVDTPLPVPLSPTARATGGVKPDPRDSSRRAPPLRPRADASGVRIRTVRCVSRPSFLPTSSLDLSDAPPYAASPSPAHCVPPGTGMDAAPRLYRQRDPTASPLYRLVVDHFAELKGCYGERLG